MKVERKITKNSRTTKINLPVEFVESLGIVINEVVDVELKNNQIIITKKTTK